MLHSNYDIFHVPTNDNKIYEIIIKKKVKIKLSNLVLQREKMFNYVFQKKNRPQN